MKAWLPLGTFVIGLVIGLLFKPYAVEEHVTPAVTILRVNRLTGRTWVLEPATHGTWFEVKEPTGTTNSGK